MYKFLLPIRIAGLAVSNLNRTVLVIWGLAFPLVAPAPRESPHVPAAICRETRKYFQDAMDESNAGDFRLGLAAMQSLLMERPVSVRVDKASTRRAYGVAIKRGLTMWSKALGYSPFVLREHPAEITIKFVDSVPDGDDLQGQVTAQYHADEDRGSAKWGLDAQIEIARGVDGRPLSRNEVTNVVGHELGHVLGLMDLPHMGGIMDYFVPGHPRMAPSEREIQTVQEFHNAVKSAIESTRARMAAR